MLWVLGLTVILFGSGLVSRIAFLFHQEDVEAKLKEIHEAKISLADITGENMPSFTGSKSKDTVEGIDENNNGIRDDVELSILNAYPDLVTRAQLMQYAFALQTMANTKYVNEDIATAVIQEKSRAYECLASHLPKDTENILEISDELAQFVEKLQLNTPARIKADDNFYKKIGSFNQTQKEFCDLKI